MKLIVGLGNIGKEYNYTPHNVGFLCLDILKEALGDFTQWHEEGIFQSIISEIVYKGERVILLKPTTYMNKSGESVLKYMLKKNIDIKDLIVIHDDLDISLGKYKISDAKGPKQHNGVLNIERRLKNVNFKRVRIGVDDREGLDISGEKYVLKRFTDTQVNIVRDLCNKISKEIIDTI